MALHLPRVLRKDRTGGSLALGELIEEYGEEIYLDLKEYWNFDLVSFIAGEVFSTIPIIYAMLRNLPEGSRFVAVAALDAPKNPLTPERRPDPRMEAVMDHRTWTLDRRMKAMEINALHSLIAVSGEWGKKGPPTFPTIGPAEWQPEDKPKLSEPKTNFDVLKRMGWPGG